MKNIVCMSVLLLIAVGIVSAQETIIFEEGFPKTIEANKQSYRIEKCEVWATKESVGIKIYGEGLDAVDKKGRYPIDCYFISNGRRYDPVGRSFPVEEDGFISFHFVPRGMRIPEPETVVLYASDNAKKQRIVISCK